MGKRITYNYCVLLLNNAKVLQCCHVAHDWARKERGSGDGRRETGRCVVRPLHSQGACNEFVAVCRRLAAARCEVRTTADAKFRRLQAKR